MGSKPQPMVHVVDDDAAMRDSLRWLLDSAGMEVRVHDTGRSILEAVVSDNDDEAPTCAVGDLRLPGMDGLTVQRRLNAVAEHIPVIVITGHGDVPSAVQAMREGARDFIEKPMDEQRLLRAVREAIEEASTPGAPGDEHDLVSLQQSFGNLSPREAQVMGLVVQGYLNKQVAQALQVSPKTVELHRSNVMQKMAAPSFAELVRMAVRLEQAGETFGI